MNETRKVSPLIEALSSKDLNVFQKLGVTIFYGLLTLVGGLADRFHVEFNDPDSTE